MNQQSKNELPKEIKINWRTYKILKKEVLPNGGNWVGHTFLDSGSMEIKKGQEHHSERVTVLHELFHCILYFTGHELQKDENFIEMFSNNWYQIIKDNPDLVKYLLTEEGDET